MPISSFYPSHGNLQQAAINFAATGDNIIVAAIAATVVRVFGLFFVASAATNIIIKDGTATLLTGAMTFNAGGALTFNLQPTAEPWFVSSLGNAFIINQSGTAQVSGRIYYLQN